MKKLSLVLTLMIAFVINANAQSPAKKGKYDFLKGETSLLITYEYDNMKVGKNLDEDDYVADKVAKGNEKEAGTGDKWKESWETSRDARYEPKFEELINDQLKKTGLIVSENTEVAKYKLIIKTVYTEPGFNVGVMKKPAAVNFVFVFVEIESGKEVATYSLDNVPGSQAMGHDYDVGSRIAESYAKGGKMLGSYIAKALK